MSAAPDPNTTRQLYRSPELADLLERLATTEEHPESIADWLTLHPVEAGTGERAMSGTAPEPAVARQDVLASVHRKRESANSASLTQTNDR